MVEATVERPLTKKEKDMIWDVIWKKMAPDDRYPCEVIADVYGGDEDKYLRVMAKCHGLELGST